MPLGPQLPVGSGWHNRKARLITATMALTQNFAGRGESMMKGGAMWMDRTSLARQGLTGAAFVGFGGSSASFGSLSVVDGASGSQVGAATVTRMGVALYHTEEYGKWLETVNGPLMGQRAGAAPEVLMDEANTGDFAIIHPIAAVVGPQMRTQVKRLWGKT
jgi:hypothetical protein